MSQPWSMRDELERIRRVSDTLCTGHARLRDRFAQRALILDLCILGLSTWLVALAFVQPRINVRLTPFGLDTQIWMGMLSVAIFFLTLVQFKTDWKGRADAHKRTLEMYAEVKREAGYLSRPEKSRRLPAGVCSPATIWRPQSASRSPRVSSCRRSDATR